jgi:hypothetical protein
VHERDRVRVRGLTLAAGVPQATTAHEPFELRALLDLDARPEDKCARRRLQPSFTTERTRTGRQRCASERTCTPVRRRPNGITSRSRGAPIRGVGAPRNTPGIPRRAASRLSTPRLRFLDPICQAVH